MPCTKFLIRLKIHCSCRMRIVEPDSTSIGQGSRIFSSRWRSRLPGHYPMRIGKRGPWAARITSAARGRRRDICRALSPCAGAELPAASIARL